LQVIDGRAFRSSKNGVFCILFILPEFLRKLGVTIPRDLITATWLFVLFIFVYTAHPNRVLCCSASLSFVMASSSQHGRNRMAAAYSHPPFGLKKLLRGAPSLFTHLMLKLAETAEYWARPVGCCVRRFSAHVRV
jgi:hypothetical protein